MESSKSRKDLILACYNRFRIQPTDAPRFVRLAKLYRLGELAMLVGEAETALRLSLIYEACFKAWMDVGMGRERHLAYRRFCRRRRKRMDGSEVCDECGSNERIEVDHIVAVHHGGPDHGQNARWLCEACNCRKHKRFDPLATLQAYMRPDSPWIRSLETLGEFVFSPPGTLQPEVHRPAGLASVTLTGFLQPEAQSPPSH